MNEHPAMLLVGLPYVRGGNHPAEGFDCYTLMSYVRQRWFHRATPTVGIPSARLSPVRAGALGIFRALGGKERIASPWIECARACGCAVALGRWRIGRLHHCGVVIDQGVLHALHTTGVVWTPLDRLRDLYGRVEFFECRA